LLAFLHLLHEFFHIIKSSYQIRHRLNTVFRAHHACPNIFLFPISSSVFSRLCAVFFRMRAIDDDDSPAAALSKHGGSSQGLCTATTPYSPGICTSGLHKDATSSLDKTKYPHQCQGPCKHMFRVSQLLQAERQT